MKHVHKRPLNVVKTQLPYTRSGWKRLPAHTQAEIFADLANPMFEKFKLDSLRIAKFNLRDPSVSFSQKMGDTLCMYFMVGEFLPDECDEEEDITDDKESTAVSCES